MSLLIISVRQNSTSFLCILHICEYFTLVGKKALEIKGQGLFIVLQFLVF